MTVFFINQNYWSTEIFCNTLLRVKRLPNTIICHSSFNLLIRTQNNKSHPVRFCVWIHPVVSEKTHLWPTWQLRTWKAMYFCNGQGLVKHKHRFIYFFTNLFSFTSLTLHTWILTEEWSDRTASLISCFLSSPCAHLSVTIAAACWI